MGIEDSREALSEIHSNLVNNWIQDAVEASNHTYRLGSRLWEISEGIQKLGAEAMELLRTNYPNEVGAMVETANDNLRDAGTTLTQLLEGTANQRAADTLVHLGEAIQEGEGMTSSIRALGPDMADSLQSRVTSLLTVMRGISTGYIHGPFRKAGAHAELLEQMPQENTVQTGVFLRNVSKPLIASMDALGAYIEEL